VRRFVGLATVLALVFAVGCTSPTSSKPNAQGSSGGTSTPRPENTVGITKNSVTISFIYADLAILAQQHLAPDLGDAAKAVQATVDEINAKGGVAGGRKLILKTHSIPNAPIATAAVLQRACVQATEEDKPFAVIIGAAVISNVVECTAIAHQQLTITMDSWRKQVYDDADGRIFSVGTPMSVDIERAYAALPTLLGPTHALEGKTIGILNQDLPADRTAAATALKGALDKAHIKLAAEATVPYPEGSLTCSQPDVAIQKMKDAHVNFVFLLAQALCAASLVKAAQDADYKPQWATLGNNVTDTVSSFMAPAKDTFDGAWGIGTVFPKATKTAYDCAAIIKRRVGLDAVPGDDAWGFAALACTQVQTLAAALDAAKAPLSQGTVIDAFQAMKSVPMIAGPPGSLSATKHDAGDYVFLEKFSAAKGKFVPYDVTPLRVP
jgi:ABC-type branched-subunit amino acid transport system substrate-binding protein